jgi:hypothetical protein
MTFFSQDHLIYQAYILAIQIFYVLLLITYATLHLLTVHFLQSLRGSQKSLNGVYFHCILYYCCAALII